MTSIVSSIASGLVRGIGPSGGSAPEVEEPAQFIINGSFATDTVWTKGAGWAIAAGVATNAGTLGVLSETMEAGLRNGNSYNFSIDFVTNTAGVNVVILIGSQTIYNAIPSAGTVAFTFVSSTTSAVIQIFDLDGDGIPGLVIDNVSLVPA